MGNRALIATKNRDLEVYVHWNGGISSVQNFLEYCRLKGYRCPEDDHYGWARLCQVIANFTTMLPGESDYYPDGNDDGLTVGIDTYGTMDADFCDNGRYIIENWRIVGRENHDGSPRSPNDETENPGLDLDMLLYIDKRQPLPLGREFIEKHMGEAGI